MRIETKCVQAGYQPENGQPRILPIYQSTTYKYDSAEHLGKLFDLTVPGHMYTRISNPTVEMVEEKIAALEGGVGAMLTSSGQAANLLAVLNIASAGDNIVCASAIYGGTINLFAFTLKRLGIETRFFTPEATDAEISALIDGRTRLVFGETVANPALIVCDIERLANIAHAHCVPLVIDNTFPTPVLCRPIEFGCDIVTHSTTKYMDGHASVVGVKAGDGSHPGADRRAHRAKSHAGAARPAQRHPAVQHQPHRKRHLQPHDLDPATARQRHGQEAAYRVRLRQKPDAR